LDTHARVGARRSCDSIPVSALVARARGRTRTSRDPRRLGLRLAARSLRMESVCRLPRLGFLHRYQDALVPPRAGSARGWRCPPAALFLGHPWGALGILLPGVVVHLYPALLQRSIMLRVQPLLERHAPDTSAKSDRS
jgi:hypothetical protein